jgi:hypothetical protein
MIYRRYTASGMIHAQDAYGRVFEADNLDDAGPYEFITAEEFAAAPLDLRCKRCFPAGNDPEASDAAVVEDYSS